MKELVGVVIGLRHSIVQDWFMLKGSMKGCIRGKNTSIVGIGIDMMTVFLLFNFGITIYYWLRFPSTRDLRSNLTNPNLKGEGLFVLRGSVFCGWMGWIECGKERTDI